MLRSPSLPALWHLSRPAGAWAAPVLPLLGYGWAHWDRAMLAWNPWGLPLVMLAWLALQTGTLWLNAARDRDDGEVLFGRSVPVPPAAVPAGLAALLCSVALASLAHPIAGACAAGAAVLSVLYSHPRLAWKSHPIGGPVINVLGYGLLSPAAGYALADSSPTLRTLPVALIICLTTLGWYYAAQSFQQQEDLARGDRTMVAMWGPRATLTATRICQGLVAIILLGLAVAGWIPRATLLCVPLFLWLDHYLVRWRRLPSGGSERWARGLATRSLVVLALLVGVVFADYVRASLADQPVAGLGTAAGHPWDRPQLPPSQLQALDGHMREHSGSPYAVSGLASTETPP